MGEELSLFRAEFNGSLRIEAREERLTGDAGGVILREVVERLGISCWLTAADHPARRRASLAAGSLRRAGRARAVATGHCAWARTYSADDLVCLDCPSGKE